MLSIKTGVATLLPGPQRSLPFPDVQCNEGRREASNSGGAHAYAPPARTVADLFATSRFLLERERSVPGASPVAPKIVSGREILALDGLLSLQRGEHQPQKMARCEVGGPEMHSSGAPVAVQPQGLSSARSTSNQPRSQHNSAAVVPDSLPESQPLQRRSIGALIVTRIATAVAGIWRQVSQPTLFAQSRAANSDQESIVAA